MHESSNSPIMSRLEKNSIARERDRLNGLKCQINPEAARQTFDDLFKIEDTKQLTNLGRIALSNQTKILRGLESVIEFTSSCAKHLEQQTAEWSWFERDMLKKRSRVNLGLIEAAKAYREIEKDASRAFELQNKVVEELRPRCRELEVLSLNTPEQLEQYIASYQRMLDRCRDSPLDNVRLETEAVAEHFIDLATKRLQLFESE